MATLYLHIGTSKTGTTAIQQLLSENTELFKKHGICYPEFDFRYAHVHPRRNGHFLISSFIGEYEKGLEQLEICAGSFDRIILTDEALWKKGRNQSVFWPSLKHDLEKRGIGLKIIVYLRRQDLLALSLYAQKVKHLNMNLDFRSFIQNMLNGEMPYPLDYCAYMDMLAELFGKDALIIRIYEKEQFQGEEQTLFSDFLSIFGLSISDGFSTEKPYYNTRIAGNNLELKRILNRLPEFGGEKHLITSVMRDVQSITPDEQRNVKCSYFAPGEQKAFLDSFAASNRELAEKYLNRPDGILFREPFEEFPTQPDADDKAFLENTFVIYGKAIETLHQQICDLAKNNQQLQEQDKTIQKLEKEASKLKDKVQALENSRPTVRLKRTAKKILGTDRP